MNEKSTRGSGLKSNPTMEVPNKYRAISNGNLTNKTIFNDTVF